MGLDKFGLEGQNGLGFYKYGFGPNMGLMCKYGPLDCKICLCGHVGSFVSLIKNVGYLHLT